MAFQGGNVDDICRLCAIEAENGVVIYSSEGMHLCLEEKILQCLQIEVSKDDILPKKVCCPCRIRLEDSHLFAEQAKKVQQKLEQLVKKNSKKVDKLTNDIKMENEDDVDGEYDELPLDVTIEFDSEDLIQSDVGDAKKVNVCDEHKKSVKQNQRPKDEIENNKSLWDDQNEVEVKEEALGDDDVSNDDDNYELVEEDLELENDITMKSEDNASRTRNEVQCSSSNNISTNCTDELVEDEEQNEDDEKLLDLNEHHEWKSQWGIKCNQCDQIFPFRSQFDKHYQASHHKKPFYTCSYCNKTMEKYSTFRSHCYRHVTEGRYRCEYCPKGFSLRSMLHVHILAKHTSEKPFVCEECGKRFVTRPGLNIHLKKHQTDKKVEYPCSDCGKILHTRGGLTNHQNVHKLGRQFMCDVCGKTFTQKVNMLQHVKQHNGERPFTCEKCGKCFAEKSHLNRHYSFHSENRPFQCTVCLKSYKTERCLKVHSMVHAEARPYVCTYCNKGFLSSSALKRYWFYLL